MSAITSPNRPCFKYEESFLLMPIAEFFRFEYILHKIPATQKSTVVADRYVSNEGT